MPKRKQNNTETTEQYSGATAATFAESETVAVMENPNYGDTATAALADVEQDRKTWRALVMECAEDGKDTPPEMLLQKLAPAVGLPVLMAISKFSEDVQAVKTLRKAEVALATYEQKKVEFVSQHATERELQQQLQDMIDQEKELRSLIAKIKHLDYVIGGKKAESRRIGNAFTRVF